MLRLPTKSLRFFVLWLVAFYTTWLAIVMAGNFWPEVAERWPIATGMLLGSYVAGSTPMGGGTVGFPVLVLLLDFPATIGRSFGLAIQSIGMVSATIFLLCRRQTIAWFLLRPAMIGAAIGMPVGLYWVAPLVGDTAVKLVFAVVWCSFGLLLIQRRRDFQDQPEAPVADIGSGFFVSVYGLIAGLVGGLLAAITGVGIDMILYAVLTLRFGVDLKISIPTSVVAMAYTSVIGVLCLIAAPSGVGSEGLGTDGGGASGIADEVFFSWLAAAPVVALGAPLGAWAVQLLPRKPTLYFVGLLCILQFVWTLYAESLSLVGVAIACISVLATIGLMYGMSILGHSARGSGNHCNSASSIPGPSQPHDQRMVCDFEG